MSSYNKWLAAQPHCRGLSLKKAFEGGEKAGQRDMLEKVREGLPDLSDLSACAFERELTDFFDQLAKEVGHE